MPYLSPVCEPQDSGSVIMPYEIEGLDELYTRLGSVRGNKVLTKPMHESVTYVENAMKVYPPQRPNSTYIRGYGFAGGPRTSEQLGKSWTTKVTHSASGVQGIVGNDTSYGPHVQSDRYQAWIHRGRWQTDKQVIEGNLIQRQIKNAFKKAVDKALAG